MLLEKEESQCMKNYEDIIELPHHVSRKHPQMTMDQRAAQFMPFVALQGQMESVRETERLTDDRIDLDDTVKEMVDRKLQHLLTSVKDRPEIKVYYFVPDQRKEGGAYCSKTGQVKKIDVYDNVVIFVDGERIPINDIMDLVGDIFPEE